MIIGVASQQGMMRVFRVTKVAHNVKLGRPLSLFPPPLLRVPSTRVPEVLSSALKGGVGDVASRDEA